MSDKSMLFIY